MQNRRQLFRPECPSASGRRNFSQRERATRIVSTAPCAACSVPSGGPRCSVPECARSLGSRIQACVRATDPKKSLTYRSSSCGGRGCDSPRRPWTLNQHSGLASGILLGRGHAATDGSESRRIFRRPGGTMVREVLCDGISLGCDPTVITARPRENWGNRLRRRPCRSHRGVRV